MSPYRPVFPSVDPIQHREDHLLARLALYGSPTAWYRLYEEAHPRVVRYATRYLSEDPEDLAAEAFSVAYASLASFRGSSRFSTWVCGIARYLSYSRYARERREADKRERLLLTRASETLTDPADLVILKHRNDCLWGAFRSLSLFDQQLLARVILMEQSFRKLAFVLQRREKPLRRAYDRALRRLKRGFLARYYHTVL